MVKRAGHAVDDSFFPNLQPAVGSKRSVRDRLGSNSDSGAQSNSKRCSPCFLFFNFSVFVLYVIGDNGFVMERRDKNVWQEVIS